MKVKVYHSMKPCFGENHFPEFNSEHYEKVAILELDNDSQFLKEAYRCTIHTSYNWTTNHDVIWFKNEQVRSTTVGDVIVDEFGNGFRCEPIGWEVLGKVEAF